MKKFKQKTVNGKLIPAIKKRKVDSEFQSYTYIKNELRELGWNVKNPIRDVNGQLYTQQECLRNPEIKSVLGKLTPEYVVKLREDAFWVMEAKPTHEELEQAYKEAVGYGELVNKHKFIRAIMVSGIAGNDIDRYLVKSGFWEEDKKKFTPIEYNEKEITGLISPDLAKMLLTVNSPFLKDLEIDEKQFVKIAEQMNQVFHASSIKKDKRATIVATILLSLLGETEPNYNATPTVFVKDINTRAHEVLKENNKGIFFQYIQIQLPEKIDAQRKFKEALVTAFFLLKKVNIKAAMRTGSDVLGKMYETFLKYGNGAKDLGILLTPRQITNFASEILNVTHKDIIYDPTCGTGGFLVSAFYHVKRNTTPQQLDTFKQHGIFGIDLQSPITALAVVNMIFRGDGKNNIINDNCFARALVPKVVDGNPSAKFVSKDNGFKSQSHPATKVLMNPPFALEKEKEYEFIDHAFQQMEDGGILFSIFPSSGMVKQRKFLTWRRSFLKKNTLLSVISLPFDLFYPYGLPTVSIIAKKGIPHPQEQNVLWLRILNDGFEKSKGKRLPDPKVPNELEKVKDTLRAFINNPQMKLDNVKEFQKATPIDFDEDSALELVPEAYLDEREPTTAEIEEGLDETIRELLSFMILARKEEDFRKEVLKEDFYEEPIEKDFQSKYVEIRITKLFKEPIETGHFHKSSALDEGNIPLISCSSLNNGVEGYFEIPLEKTYKHAITIASDGQPLATFYHYYTFAAKDNVMVCFAKEKLRFQTMLFIVMQLNRLRWRFSYGRKCYLNKKEKVKIYLPLKDDGKIDEDYIEYLVKKRRAWQTLLHLFPR